MKILEYPHSILKQVATPVLHFDKKLKENAEKMIELLYSDDAVGLAANQVGLSARFFVMDTSPNQDSPLCLINPEILSAEGEGLSQEGCMSLPGIYLTIPRPNKVTVKYQDLEGETKTLTAEDLAAYCIQHELEHLNGILAIDHFSKLKRALYVKKILKAKRFETQ